MKTLSIQQNKYKYYRDNRFICKNLPNIKTCEEIKRFIGKPLIYGYFESDDDIIPYCAWMGKVSEIMDKHDNHVDLRTIPCFNDDFIIIYRKQNLLIPYKDKTNIFSYVQSKKSSTAQDFIWIPNNELITYYEICLEYIKKLSK